MPKFIDRHARLTLTAEDLASLRTEAQAGAYDRFESRHLDLLYCSDGSVFCLLEAPNEEAVRHRHIALGLTCEDVQQVRSLL